MKRLLTAASVIATLAAPALASAQDYQNQGQRPDQRNPAMARPIPGRPAPGTIMRVDPGRPGTVKPVWARGDRTWWRNRPEFRGFAGVRPGFWFRPGVGYVRVDPRWYGYGWRVGGRVPVEFRGYYVQSPELFGLGRPPYGYVYVYLGNNIALMQRATGLIVQVYPNIY